MQNINFRANNTHQNQPADPFDRIERGGRKRSKKNKSGVFSSRTCVALAVGTAAGIIGTLYLLTNSQRAVPQLAISERIGTATCFNADQYTVYTGRPAPDGSDLYCIYSNQTTPYQMADLMNHGIISMIEEAGNLIYQGARNTFECINYGLGWRQYNDASVCVHMNPDTCRSLGGHINTGSSICLPAIDLDRFYHGASACTNDLTNICEWYSQNSSL